jgi:hypothetical protein
LSTQIASGAGIDVNKSGVGHESEVILPPGVYMINVHKQIKKYAHQIADADVDINQVIINMSVADVKKSGASEATLFDYVMHHHVSELNPAARAHLFKLSQPDPHKPMFVYKVEPVSSWDHTPDHKVTFQYYIPCYHVFALYKQGVFQAPAQKASVVKWAKQIMREALPVFALHIIAAERMDMGLIRQVAQIAGMEPELDRMLQRTVGAEYKRLGDQGRLINKIQDPKAHEKALRDHSEQLKQLMSKIN